MIELFQTRRWLSPKTTISELTIGMDPALWLYTLEDFRREIGEPKVPRETAIPEGRYRIIRNWSKRFERMMPLLYNLETKEGRLLVQNNGLTFEGVRVHWGNTEVDTDGCILVGRARMKDKILTSMAAFQEFDSMLTAWLEQKHEVYVDIRLAPALERLVS